MLGNCGKSRLKLYSLVNRLRLDHYNLSRHRGWPVDRRLTVKMRIALSHSSRLLHLCAERRSPRHQVSGFSLAHLDTPLHRRRGCLPSPFLVESLFLKSGHDCPSPSSPCFCHPHVDAPLVNSLRGGGFPQFLQVSRSLILPLFDSPLRPGRIDHAGSITSPYCPEETITPMEAEFQNKRKSTGRHAGLTALRPLTPRDNRQCLCAG